MQKNEKSAIQTFMNSIGTRLKVDGQIGFSTARALNRLPVERKLTVEGFATVMRVDLPDLYTWNEINVIVSEVTRDRDVPPSYLLKMIELENRTTTSSILVEYEGSFKGIAQFNEETWALVTRVPYSFVNDVSLSLIAASSLYQHNRVDFNRTFPDQDFTDDIAYLYHNQGTPSANKFLKFGDITHPHQSEAALAVLAEARKTVLKKAIS